MIAYEYAKIAWEQAQKLLAIDSPSGYTAQAANWVKEAFEAMGFSAWLTTKGGVIADLGGKDPDDAFENMLADKCHFCPFNRL